MFIAVVLYVHVCARACVHACVFNHVVSMSMCVYAQVYRCLIHFGDLL